MPFILLSRLTPSTTTLPAVSSSSSVSVYQLHYHHPHHSIHCLFICCETIRSVEYYARPRGTTKTILFLKTITQTFKRSNTAKPRQCQDFDPITNSTRIFLRKSPRKNVNGRSSQVIANKF